MRADSNRVIDHGCGQLFIQQRGRGLFAKPALIEVNQCLALKHAHAAALLQWRHQHEIRADAQDERVLQIVLLG